MLKLSNAMALALVAEPDWLGRFGGVAKPPHQNVHVLTILAIAIS